MPRNQGHPGVGHLALPRLAAKLANGFDHVEHPAAVAFGEQAAAGVDGQAAPRTDAPPLDESAALALLAEAVILELEQDDDGEAVVEKGEVNISRAEASLSKSGRARTRGRKRVEMPRRGVGRKAVGLGVAENPDAPSAQVGGPFLGGHDHRRGAVGDQATIQA